MENNKLPLILLEGEGYTVEFKEKLAKNIDREIVAFANSAGGSIYLGVDDSGAIKPVNITNALKSRITTIAHDCDPSITIQMQIYPDDGVLEIKVTEGIDKPYRCKDGFFMRIGPNCQKLKRDEIVAFINATGKIHFDEALNDSFQYPDDFSQEAFDDFLNLSGIITHHSTENVLLSLNAVQKKKHRLCFTNAAVLLFAKEPQKFYPESYITAVKYKSQDRFSIIDKKDFKGSLFKQIENTMQFMMRHISVAAEISTIKRQDIYDYPLVALREAIVNAVTHRDYYYDGSHIYVHMYPDRIEIENPGGLHHGLTIDNLGKRSVRRNRLIADFLHRAGYIERVGSGFDRMHQTLMQNNNPPLVVSATNFFNICFYKRIQNKRLAELTQRQRDLYYLMQEKTITKKEVAMALNISEDTALRELNALLTKGIILKEGVGKATIYLFADTNM